MKLFSRTSLVALGTAAAITVSGVTAPAFAQEDTTNINYNLKAAEESEEPEEPSNASSNASSNTDKISDWIKIITAVIGALTAILTFSTKLDSFLK